mgnify:FL=1
MKSSTAIKIEVCLFDGYKDFDELLEVLFICDQNCVDVISVPISFLSYKQRFTKNATPACLVDFPLGMGSLRTRLAYCIEAVSLGAEILDIPVNPFHVQNMQKTNIKKDVSSIAAFCKERGVKPRYILNHKEYSMKEYVHLSSWLYSCGVKTLITHDGVTVDDPIDNLIAAGQVLKNIPLEVIPGSRMFETEHLDILTGTEIESIRVCSDKINRFF